MSDKLTIETCPVHGGIVSVARPCRKIIARVEGRITYCHEAEEVEVVPVTELERVEGERDKLRDEQRTALVIEMRDEILDAAEKEPS